jgi:hypothetical protein
VERKFSHRKGAYTPREAVTKLLGIQQRATQMQELAIALLQITSSSGCSEKVRDGERE